MRDRGSKANDYGSKRGQDQAVSGHFLLVTAALHLASARQPHGPALKYRREKEQEQTSIVIQLSTK